MFQLSCFEGEAPVVKGQLPSSRFFLKFPFLRLSWLKRQIFMNFSSQSKFLQSLRPATLLKKKLWHRCFPVNFVKFLRTPPVAATLSSRSVSTEGRTLLLRVKEISETRLRINTVCNFQAMKIAVELHRLLLKFLILCDVVDIQEISREDNPKQPPEVFCKIGCS